MLVCLIILLHFSCFASFRYKWLPQCKIDISRQQFVPMSGMSGFQNLTLNANFLKVVIVQKVKIFNLLILTFKVPNL